MDLDRLHQIFEQHLTAVARVAATTLYGIREAYARELVGRRVRWAHDACGACGTLLVTRATADGLVELEGWSGQFSPDAFVEV